MTKDKVMIYKIVDYDEKPQKKYEVGGFLWWIIKLCVKCSKQTKKEAKK